MLIHTLGQLLYEFFVLNSFLIFSGWQSFTIYVICKNIFSQFGAYLFICLIMSLKHRILNFNKFELSMFFFSWLILFGVVSRIFLPTPSFWRFSYFLPNVLYFSLHVQVSDPSWVNFCEWYDVWVYLSSGGHPNLTLFVKMIILSSLNFVSKISWP